MDNGSKIYVAGHRGLAGSALVRRLKTEGCHNLVLYTHGELDLTRQTQVEDFFAREAPEYVFLAAAKVGGIWANSIYPAEFVYSNLAIQTNVLEASWKSKVKRLIFLGSSCIYPKECPQPIREGHFLTGPLEPTNQPYAVAKIAGVIQCEAYNRQFGTRFLAVMPTNLYGPNDNFDLENSHVLPATIRRFHLAKLAAGGHWEAIGRDERRFGPIPSGVLSCLAAISRSHNRQIPEVNERRAVAAKGSPAVVLWGSGRPRREFMHVDDMAEACLFLMNLPEDQFIPLLLPKSGGTGAAHAGRSAVTPMPLINIGSGKDDTIRDLAVLVAGVIGFEGDVIWDDNKPDGMDRKLLDVSRINGLGWKHRISLKEGVKAVYHWYQDQYS